MLSFAYQLPLNSLNHVQINSIARPGLYKWVVDPVMVATSGDALVQNDAVEAIKSKLFPHAYIITPNIPETCMLLNRQVQTLDEKIQVPFNVQPDECTFLDLVVCQAAKDLALLGPRFVLVKGGHDEASGQKLSVDVLYDSLSGISFRSKGTTILCKLTIMILAGDVNQFPSVKLNTENTHGTGCTLASSIAAGLAQGLSPLQAVQKAKNYVWEAIKNRYME